MQIGIWKHQCLYVYMLQQINKISLIIHQDLYHHEHLKIFVSSYIKALTTARDPDVSDSQMHLTAIVSDSQGRAGMRVNGYVY